MASYGLAGDTPKAQRVYTSEFGFAFSYPRNWKIKFKETDHRSGAWFYNPQNKQQSISFSVVSDPESPECPMTIHVVDCKELINPFGIKYVRVVSTGQQDLSNQQQLNIYFSIQKNLVNLGAVISDRNGKNESNSAKNIEVIDSIISSVKYSNTDSAQQGAPPDANSGRR